MTASVSSSPTCYICKKAVNIESATADELGRTVHAGCYFLKIVAKPASPPTPRPKA
jgi:hypothetical protein